MTVASLPTVILTGGCGYIATHTLTFLLEHPYNVIILDNLSNSTIEGVNRVQQRIANEAAGRVLGVHEIDICDEALLRSILKKYKDDGVDLKACIHFAGLKAVGESVRESLMYYQNNIYCTIALVKVLGEVGVSEGLTEKHWQAACLRVIDDKDLHLHLHFHLHLHLHLRPQQLTISVAVQLPCFFLFCDCLRIAG